jgi:DNA-binding NtrC family response regulator
MTRPHGDQLRTSRARHILVVDDYPSAREAMAEVLSCAGYRVTQSASATEALARIADERPEVVVTDLQMPGMDGLEFIRELVRRQVEAQVLMVTAHASVDTAVEAMRLGAFDYIEKPLDATRLEECVAKACDRGRLLARTSSNEVQVAGIAGETMIGSSPIMQELRARIAQVAPTDETVLICGESGTGKERVARLVHALSPRAEKSLVSLNCPVLSSQLTESELFGHRRGAFTGADRDRVGRFELAAGGSILLDEVTEIDLGLQAKLLRVLQERSFEPVGASESMSVDVRVLATTNRDLQQMIELGRFREDLYYRLAVVPLHVPPLRERGTDVLELADYFLESAAHRLGRAVAELEAAARDLLAEYHWPGNVRELQNIITRACVLNDGSPIYADQIRPWLRLSSAKAKDSEKEALPVGLTLEEVERRLIIATLERFGGHRSKTAEALGIGVRTLSGKLRTYGFAPGEKKFAA